MQPLCLSSRGAEEFGPGERFEQHGKTGWHEETLYVHTLPSEYSIRLLSSSSSWLLRPSTSTLSYSGASSTQDPGFPSQELWSPFIAPYIACGWQMDSFGSFRPEKRIPFMMAGSRSEGVLAQLDVWPRSGRKAWLSLRPAIFLPCSRRTVRDSRDRLLL